MIRIKQDDVVETTKPLPGVPKGAIGTIVIEYIGGQNVEVEFPLKDGTKIVTVLRGDVERVS